MVTRNKIQCIVQGSKSGKAIQIKKGDVLSVEIDMPEMNLVQCKAYY
jgi:hypothetical protein